MMLSREGLFLSQMISNSNGMISYRSCSDKRVENSLSMTIVMNGSSLFVLCLPCWAQFYLISKRKKNPTLLRSFISLWYTTLWNEEEKLISSPSFRSWEGVGPVKDWRNCNSMDSTEVLMLWTRPASMSLAVCTCRGWLKIPSVNTASIPHAWLFEYYILWNNWEMFQNVGFFKNCFISAI